MQKNSTRQAARSLRRQNSSLSLLVRSLFGILLLSGCAGPATPLGSIWAKTPSEAAQLVSEDEPASPTSGAEGVKIEFRPARQILHGPKPFTIRIEDTAGIPEEPRMQIRYDGIDVTTSFLRQATFVSSKSSTQFDLKVPVVRLSPQYDHRIEVRYYNAAGQASYSQYQAPVCRIFDWREVRHTDDFEPDPKLLTTIEKLAAESQVNPSLITGLIAQESSFNPRTVSWAKALGLTQVTPIADEELFAQKNASLRTAANVSTDIASGEWPRYKGMENLPSSLVKMLVLSGQINETNEWRLDKKLSVQGGLAYLRMLEKKWSSPEVKSRFTEEERTRLLLASYNSGFTRVQTALRVRGKNWLSAPELSEARRYVNRIFSFCDFFSQDDTDVADSEPAQPDSVPSEPSKATSQLNDRAPAGEKLNRVESSYEDKT